MNGLDVVRYEALHREVNQVEGCDRLRSTRDGCRGHMSVVGIGESEPYDKRLPVLDLGVIERVVHLRQSPVEGGGVDISLSQHVATDFGEDRLRPERAETLLLGKGEHSVAEKG